MKLTINVKLRNEDFNQSIADDFYNGEESEDNVKYIWEDEFVVAEEVARLKIRNSSTYTLAGQLPDGKEFSYDIDFVTVVECTGTSGKVHSFVFSKKLIKSTNKTESSDKNEVTFEVILKDGIRYYNPMDGIYIVEEHFPSELKPYATKE